MNNKTLHMVAFVLVIVGGINWGLWGLVNFDLVAWLFVDILGIDILARLVYILVGVAAVYELVTHKKNCVACGAGTSAGQRSADASSMGASGGM